MQVILREKIAKLGVLGDVVNVKPGYFRNFLHPFGKAVRATKQNVEAFEAQKAELEKQEKARLETALATAEVIKSKLYTIAARAGEGGKLFGSIGKAEVAKAICDEIGEEIKKSQVRIPEGAIRNIGEFESTVCIHADVSVDIKVNVVATKD